MLYTTEELIKCSGISERTFYRRLQSMKEKKKFAKKSPGITYDTTEAKKISSLLLFADTFAAYHRNKLSQKATAI